MHAGDTPGAVPYLDASDPSLPTLLEAARNSRVVRFDYTKSGESEPQRRVLEPWGVLSWRRRWYVAGFDRDRDEARSFRLSRISGKVEFVGKPGAFERPEKVDLREMIAGRAPEHTRTARVRVNGSGAGQLRRIAEGEIDGELTISFTDANQLARLIAAAGPGAHALDPPDLVDAVMARLAIAAGSPS